MMGNVRMGATVTGSPSANSSILAMQVRRGRPFTSALQEPHRPALQFHRTARSPAWVAWMRCSTSRTTSPSSTVVR